MVVEARVSRLKPERRRLIPVALINRYGTSTLNSNASRNVDEIWKAIYNSASVRLSQDAGNWLTPHRHTQPRIKNLAPRAGPVRPRPDEKEQPRPRRSGRTDDPSTDKQDGQDVLVQRESLGLGGAWADCDVAMDSVGDGGARGS